MGVISRLIPTWKPTRNYKALSKAIKEAGQGSQGSLVRLLEAFLWFIKAVGAKGQGPPRKAFEVGPGGFIRAF